jgi:hypothetical protein
VRTERSRLTQRIVEAKRHQIITLLKTLFKPFERAVLVSYPQAYTGHHYGRDVSGFCRLSIIFQPAFPIALCA